MGTTNFMPAVSGHAATLKPAPAADPPPPLLPAPPPHLQREVYQEVHSMQLADTLQFEPDV